MQLMTRYDVPGTNSPISNSLSMTRSPPAVRARRLACATAPDDWVCSNDRGPKPTPLAEAAGVPYPHLGVERCQRRFGLRSQLRTQRSVMQKKFATLAGWMERRRYTMAAIARA